MIEAENPPPAEVAKSGVAEVAGVSREAFEQSASQPKPKPDPHPMDLAVERDAPYASFLDPAARWYCVFANANVGYRVGPMQGPEVGAIITRANEIGIPVLVTLETPTPDWEYIMDLNGGAEALAKRKAAMNPAAWYSVDWDKAVAAILVDVKPGDYLLVDDSFDEISAGLHLVRCDARGSYIEGDDGCDYLLKDYLKDDGTLDGIRRPLKTRDAEAAQPTPKPGGVECAKCHMILSPGDHCASGGCPLNPLTPLTEAGSAP